VCPAAVTYGGQLRRGARAPLRYTQRHISGYPYCCWPCRRQLHRQPRRRVVSGGVREPGRGPVHRAELRGPGVERHIKRRQRQHRLPSQLRRRLQQSELRLLACDRAGPSAPHFTAVFRGCGGCTQSPFSNANSAGWGGPTCLTFAQAADAANTGLLWHPSPHRLTVVRSCPAADGGLQERPDRQRGPGQHLPPDLQCLRCQLLGVRRSNCAQR
jgi:hypothetical protein